MHKTVQHAQAYMIASLFQSLSKNLVLSCQNNLSAKFEINI